MESDGAKGVADGDGGAANQPADTGTCDRISGTQPRNRQHRASEYYFGNLNTSWNLSNTPQLVARYNPYRTQLTFSGFLASMAASCYIKPTILSYPLHGFLVIEQWWAVFDGCPAVRLANSQANALANIYALSIPLEGGQPAFGGLSATLQVGEYYYSD